MSKRAPGRFERRPRDYYPTPEKMVAPLVPYLRQAGIHRFCEPCCGDGSLVRALEASGFLCDSATDIADGIDALTITRFPEAVITNPPYVWKVLRPLLEHFLIAAPELWLLLPTDWTQNLQTACFMRHATDVIPARRIHWPGTPSGGTDNHAWIRFLLTHRTGPLLHPAGVLPHGARPCEVCGRSFVSSRSDAKFCGDTCRQRAHRHRLAVTEP